MEAVLQRRALEHGGVIGQLDGRAEMDVCSVEGRHMARGADELGVNSAEFGKGGNCLTRRMRIADRLGEGGPFSAVLDRVGVPRDERRVGPVAPARMPKIAISAGEYAHPSRAGPRGRRISELELRRAEVQEMELRST